MRLLRGVFLGWPQVFFLIILLAVAAAAWNISAPDWMLPLAPSIAAELWGRLLAVYCLIIIGSHLIVHPAVAVLRAAFCQQDQEPTTDWLPVFAGSCEAVLFASAFHIGKPVYIAVWLALKIAAGWKLWEPGRNRFGVFVIGNGLCIGSAYLGAKVIAAVLRQAP
jgi:hypothetical protein